MEKIRRKPDILSPARSVQAFGVAHSRPAERFGDEVSRRVEFIQALVAFGGRLV
jgi:hypothetical protein